MTRGPAKQFDRGEVLDRAMHLFWTKGYEATGMTELLQHMGIGRQSLYDTFGDKKSLYVECLEHYFGQRAAMTREVLRGPGSPLGNLKKMFRKMMEMSEQTGHCGCMIGNAVAEFGERDDELPRVLSRFFAGMREEFRDVLSRAKDQGELGPDVSVDGMAHLMLTTAQGLALLSKIEPGRKIADSVLETSFAMMTAD